MPKPGTWTSNVTIHSNGAANATFTNMPAADTFLFSSPRHIQMIDLEGMTLVRFKVNKMATAGQAGATLSLRFSKTFSTVTSDYTDIGVTPVQVPVDVVNTYLDSGWIELRGEATNEDVYLAVIGGGGNGVLDPTFGTISASFV